ncbi:nucleotidyl transferase AbiEii/AbiGii toxin family protein [Paraburkholderia silviterrae]|uniref:Nucleotidyl transferase AbiEii/AbiGii toxin family protein n=1 Tax=Paraburkholderia silviterrae TaxID=2528715 RepID=A0A4R5MDP3_9BURK|nr:nucleotidyl transferase AbiEii/AbiGii toxin family protein [Paraburkholderia silviterrae]TDG25212.1 nucleotidyl transferase AbiEii/AbiGii toxin family protein [Paraburkholderia silviterrae]
MSTPSSLPSGPWQTLFRHALTLVDEIRTYGTSSPFWTFGGGTVLMLRYGHRMSKDIDIFVPNPQYLGYVNPRINDTASGITTDYDEHAGFVKLILPEGEIDFVVSPNLTSPGYDEWTLMGQLVKVETAAEIVAKKMWYRGDRPTARDLFDLSLVIEKEPDSLRAASAYLIRHRETFLRLLVEHREFLMSRFNDMETLRYTPSFDYCVGLAIEFLTAMPGDTASR